MINKKDITFVVQGPIGTDEFSTKKALQSIREYFPSSQIILSTWEGSNIDELTFDEVIFNKDPGPLTYFLYNSRSNDKLELKNNMNRQIVSTLNGLKKTTTPYAVKFRSDFILTNDKFLSIYEKYNHILDKQDQGWGLFSERVLMTHLYTINPRRCDLPHHPTDCFHFGLTDDLLNLWDIPFYDEKDTTYFTEESLRNKTKSWASQRYTSEQFLWLSFLDKNNIKYRKPNTSFDINEEITRETELSLINNTIIYDGLKMGLHSRFNIWFSNHSSCFTNNDFLELYYKYVDKNNLTVKKIAKRVRMIRFLERFVKVRLRSDHKFIKILGIGLIIDDLFNFKHSITKEKFKTKTTLGKFSRILKFIFDIKISTKECYLNVFGIKLGYFKNYDY